MYALICTCIERHAEREREREMEEEDRRSSTQHTTFIYVWNVVGTCIHIDHIQSCTIKHISPEVIEPSEATGGRHCFLAEYIHALAACQAYQ